MSAGEEKPLDAEQWRAEARAVINDVRAHVRELRLSSVIPSSSGSVHLNLTSLEGREFCVRLTAQGFSVVGSRHDCTDLEAEEPQHYETVYGLLDSLSPRYRDSFGGSLREKLQRLSDGQS